ncbi:MAG: MBL fold metallo-hydrolase [Eubacteriales bacterium]|jgi:glyoxylase-like metal-dependent hydrolase (beta-lactamase superfamily II)|nr:MBL fold metallo-hydrolase [Eubacteriales bacterium]
MYELHKITENCYYIQSPAKIGLIRLDGNDVCLIDSGNDKDAGRKIRQILDANGWHLRAIYNTHSNADHIGGNKYLQTQTGCDIFAPGIERDFTIHPVLEPSFLYGGFPPQSLRHKFLMAQESEADELTQEALPEGVSVIPLPGHFFDMVGYRSADGAVYLADCLSSKETLEKYQITFLYDVAAYLQTLEMVKTLEAKVFIPAHAEATENIAPLAQHNIDKVHEIAAKILESCKRPVIFESVLQQLFLAFGLMMTIEQYVLVGSTVRSYLSWLKDTGRVDYSFENGQMLWLAI